MTDTEGWLLILVAALGLAVMKLGQDVDDLREDLELSASDPGLFEAKQKLSRRKRKAEAL